MDFVVLSNSEWRSMPRKNRPILPHIKSLMEGNILFFPFEDMQVAKRFAANLRTNAFSKGFRASVRHGVVHDGMTGIASKWTAR